MIMKLFAAIFFTATSLLAQTNDFTATNHSGNNPAKAPASTSPQAEQIRAECLQGRRSICGKIIKVLPDGLVVESGYTNLLRAPLDKSWLVPGSVVASRAANLIEGREPGCVAVGLVFLTGLPKVRGTKPQLYDYVVMQGYPASQVTYSALGDIKRTVRRFAANLPKAVQLIADENQNSARAATVK